MNFHKFIILNAFFFLFYKVSKSISWTIKVKIFCAHILCKIFKNIKITSLLPCTASWSLIIFSAWKNYGLFLFTMALLTRHAWAIKPVQMMQNAPAQLFYKCTRRHESDFKFWSIWYLTPKCTHIAQFWDSAHLQ